MKDLLFRPGFQGFIVEENGNPVGYMLGYIHRWWSAYEYHLEEMFIGNEYQRQGYGSFIMKNVRSYFAQRDIHRIVLMTGRDTPAQSFYAAHGFRTNPRVIMMASDVKPE